MNIQFSKLHTEDTSLSDDESFDVNNPINSNLASYNDSELKNSINIDEINEELANQNLNQSSEDTLIDYIINSETSTFHRLLAFFRLALPISISSLFSLSGGLMVLFFSSQLKQSRDDIEFAGLLFAAVSLSNMFMNVTALAPLSGMTGAVETLVSQYFGAKEYRKVGIVLQRSILILTFILPFIIIIFYFSYPFFLYLGVEEKVCSMVRAQLFVRLISLPVEVFNMSYSKYLYAIGVTKPSLITSIVFNSSNFICCFLSAYVLNSGYLSLSYSWCISYYLSTIANVISSYSYDEVQLTIQKPSWDAFNEWLPFIKLGIPGTIMLCSEWWAYEILAIFASILGTEEIEAQSIILQTASLAYMFPMGLGIVGSSLVGNSLGKGLSSMGIYLAQFCLKVTIFTQFLIGIIIFFFGKSFASLFTSDDVVLEMCDRMVPVLAIFTIFDGLQGSGSGILRGSGNQFIGAVTNLIAFYVFGLPLSYYVTFNLKFGVQGLISGLSIGTFLQVIVLFILIFCIPSKIFNKVSTSNNSNKENISFMPLKVNEDENESSNDLFDDDLDEDFNIMMSTLNSKV